MKLTFPSHDYDETVAAVCHGSFSEEQAGALNELLCNDHGARDEYILRVELHARLASEQDLFVSTAHEVSESGMPGRGIGLTQQVVGLPAQRQVRSRKVTTTIALAMCLALLLTGWWGVHEWRQNERKGATSTAVAMLNRGVNAQWSSRDKTPVLGSPLEPGWLRLKSGLAQVVFYSGARVVIEGPAELQIISAGEASCRVGRLTAEVPPQASGFRIGTPQMKVTDLGTVFGLYVKQGHTELHVFKGRVEFQSADSPGKQNLQEGSGAVTEVSHTTSIIIANRAGFASLFDLQARSAVAESLECNQWRRASRQLNQDPSLLVHFDFEHATIADWQLRNVSSRSE
ncbi:MAG: FecR protein, partial [Verrucomicrobiales bacterium]|nr:FecR protein [Verrucomicrobiales bacterium]